jgi:polyadenylate-binding protein
MTEPKKEFTLYIGDIDPAVTEQDLNELFRGLSITVKNIRIVSSHNAQSEGNKYAFVTFENREDAERSRRDLNDSVLCNRHIRVCFMNRNRSTAANLFIKGLGNVSARDLENHFSSHGNITSCKVLHDEKGVSRGYGFLQFERQEDAEAAIKHKHETVFAGNTITVERFVARDQRETPTSNNIYVRGFGPEISSEVLRRKFEEFGEVSSTIILPNKSPIGEDRFFGFVCYTSSESASKAIQAVHGREEGGVNWYVAPHLSRRDRVYKLKRDFKEKQDYWKQRNLYISKLHSAIDEEKLHKLFRDFGEITSVKVLKSENIKYDAEGNKYFEQLSRGSGFVCFKQADDAERALTQMDRKKVEDREIRVFRWKPKSEMIKIMSHKRHRMQQYQMYMMPPNVKGGPRPNFRGNMPMQMPMMQPEANVQSRPPYQHNPNPAYHQHPQQHRQHRPQPREPVAVPHPEQIPQQAPINMKEYNEGSNQDKKRLLGENLYPRILKLTNQNVAGKVTGMLLEMKNEELLEMLTLVSKLREKVEEAIEVLREAWKTRPDQLALLSR